MRTGRSGVIGLAGTLALTLALAPSAAADSHQTQAERYCEDNGGNVLRIKPYLYAGTENEVELAGTLEVCQFISTEDDDPVQLVVDLDTLHSEKPTLAGLAYLAAVPSSNSGAAGSNPAASYCPNDLGGTEQFGTSATGAWVGEFDPGMEAGFTEPLGPTVDLCVFADRSAIDDFGIFYASDGTYRGVDLASVMRYQPDDDTPDVFATDG